MVIRLKAAKAPTVASNVWTPRSHQAMTLHACPHRSSVYAPERVRARMLWSLSPPPPLSPYLSLSLLSRIFNPMPKLSVAVKMTKTLQLSSPQTLHTGLKRTVKPLGPLMPWLGLLRPVQFPFSIFPSFFCRQSLFPQFSPGVSLNSQSA